MYHSPMRRITTSDQELLLEISPCDDEQVDLFTSSDCWKLARELHLRGVGKLAAISESSDPDYWCHMAVELPDGTYLDAQGVQSREQFLTRWRGFVLRGDAAISYYDPRDEAHWEALTEDQEPDVGSQEDVDSAAELLIEWLEDL